MIDNHIQFETLCALAASGQLTQKELSDFRDHSDFCAVCKERLRKMEQVGEGLFLTCALAETSERLPKGMCERFVARANREGIPLRPRSALFSSRYTPLMSAFALLVVAVCIASTWQSSVSTRSISAGSSPVSPSMDSDGQNFGSSQGEQVLLAADRTLTVRAAYRKGGTRSGHKHQTPDSVAAASRKDNLDIHPEMKAPHFDFVMYSPRPRFSGHSIPSFSMRWGGQTPKPQIQRETSVFDHAFMLKEQKPLLEASTESQQPLAQYAYLPNGTLNFRFIPSDFQVPQGITH